jgi:hypothetical protein
MAFRATKKEHIVKRHIDVIFFKHPALYRSVYKELMERDSAYACPRSSASDNASNPHRSKSGYLSFRVKVVAMSFIDSPH